jgi:hypothetical protein
MKGKGNVMVEDFEELRSVVDTGCGCASFDA